METSFVLALVGLTSVAAAVVGTRLLGLRAAGLGAALGRMFETLGIIACFFGLNLVVGGLAILAARAVGPWFVSVYVADDVALLGLSLFQGLVFEAWRDSPRRGVRP